MYLVTRRVRHSEVGAEAEVAPPAVVAPGKLPLPKPLTHPDTSALQAVAVAKAAVVAEVPRPTIRRTCLER